MQNEVEDKEIVTENNGETVAGNDAAASLSIVENESKDRRRNERRPSRRPERVRQEFDSKTISVRRVTRVTSGGRRFSFSIAMVIGDKKGRVGVGVGKASDTPIAIDKAMRAAKKSMVTIPLNKRNSIAHPVEAKYSSAIVSIMPAPGKGMTAGSAVRTVLELAGVKEVSAKILSRSKNKLNIARAAIKALGQLKSTNSRVQSNFNGSKINN